MSIFLQENNTFEVPELVKKSKGVVIIPIGSVEQHGGHLPLGTDTYLATVIAEDAAKQTNSVVTPPLWFGWSPHHMVLPGTVTIRPEILIEFIYDIIESLSKHKFTKIVLVNGHRIVNIPWMQIAVEKAQRQLGVKVVIFDLAYMSKSITKKLGFGPLGHAEEIETSHMLYKYPERVHLEYLKDNPTKNRELYSADPGYIGDTLCYIPATVEDMKETIIKAGGTMGEPSKSSKEKGEIYHNHLVKNLIKVIKSLAKEDKV